MTFVERAITLSIKLAQAGTNSPSTFASTGADTVTIAGARCTAQIQNSGSLAGSQANISVWGIAPALMNQLSTLGMVIQLIPRNTISVAVGDVGGAMTTVFIGTIIQAYPDLTGAPDVPFRFECLAGAAEAALPVPVSSYDGSTDVVTLLSSIARLMNWTFENSGVEARLSNPYYAGSAMDQVRQIARDANINAQVLNNTLAVWPRYGSRQNFAKPLVAAPPDGAMIGSPSFTQQGIMVRTVFDRRITFGAQIEVRSTVLPKASGTWNVLKLDHNLATKIAKGPWESTAYCYNPNFPAPLPPTN